MIKPQIDFSDFDKVDIRVGRVLSVEDFPEAKKPAFKLKIDLGEEIGIKKSSAQLVGAHTKDELKNALVMCVVNFAPRQVGPFISEVLTLGFANAEGSGYIVATASKKNVKIGEKLS